MIMSYVICPRSEVRRGIAGDLELPERPRLPRVHGLAPQRAAPRNAKRCFQNGLLAHVMSKRQKTKR